MNAEKWFYTFENIKYGSEASGSHTRSSSEVAVKMDTVFHSHPCTELVFNYGCSGVLYHNDEEMEYSGGTFFTYQPGGFHYVKNKTPGKQVCLGISGSHAEQIPIGVFKINPSIEALVNRIKDENGSGKLYTSEYLDLLAGQLSLELLRVTQVCTEHNSLSYYAQSARAYLDANFEKKVSLTDLAENLSISPDYLRQIFREAFGMPPLNYLIEKRLAYACHLLWGSDFSLAKIAIKCGVGSQYYFSRLFKNKKGLSPLAYRKKYRRIG
jgi:AraC family transcriptional activator of pobA